MFYEIFSFHGVALNHVNGLMRDESVVAWCGAARAVCVETSSNHARYGCVFFLPLLF